MLADLLVCHDLAHSPQLLQVCEGCRPAQRHGLQTPPLYHLPEFLVCSREVTVSLSQWDCGWRQIATFKVAHVIRLCSITRADSCRCNARHFLCTANQHLHFVTIRRMNEQLRPSAAQQGMSQAQCAPNVTGLTMHEVQHGTWQQAAEKSLHSFMKIAFIDGWFNCKVKDLPGCETSNASTYISTEFQSTVQGEEEIIVTFRKYTQCTNNISKEQLCYHFNSVSCRCAWTVPLAIPYLMILILKLLLFLCLQNGDARNRCFIYCDDQMHVFEQQSLRDKRQVPSTCHATAFCASHHHLLSHSSLQELDSQCIWCIQCHQWSSPRKLYMLTCAKPEYNCWSSPLCLAILSEPRTRSRTLCEMFASACSNSSSVLATFATAAK